MNRIADRLALRLSTGGKALALYMMAGYPERESTVPLACALAEAGADIIELGIPFSDPIADGPVIQACSERALRNGITVGRVLAAVEEIRRSVSIPLVLMGYANPVYRFGMDRFLSTAHGCGVDGLIVPDLPVEESGEYRTLAERAGIAAIFLASPVTPDARLRRLDEASRGFLYCVSVTGVTGERKDAAAQAADFLRRARSIVKRNPLLVGFGIATPDDARSAGKQSDGVIIGSALMKIVGRGDGDLLHRAAEFARTVRTALDESR